jgi:lysophospholipase L1-like esterase
VKRLPALLGALLVGALAAPVVAVAAPDTPLPPGTASTPGSVPSVAPARTDVPATVAVVGDSISQGTGSNGRGAPGGGIGSPRPDASWATGRQAGLDSYAQRLEHTRGRPVTTIDLSANGASIRDHLVDQVQAVPAGTDLVLVQMGGNDLCRSSVDDMTPLDQARNEIRTALTWLREHRPDTLVSVSSIPDVYSLWYVRGAAHRGEQFPFVGFVVSGREGPRAPRSFAENNNKRAARILWDTLGVVPCRTLLFRPNVPRNAGPTPDPTNSAERRRLRVREHNIALNEILAEECAAILRCRFDDHAVFDLVSNRDADGVLLADKHQWGFNDDDISTQDHFHPSFQGQRKLADTMWRAGHDWTDVYPPAASITVNTSRGIVGPSSHGWYTGPVSVDLWFRDDVGVRGVEYRVHGPGDTGDDGRELPWSHVIADHISVSVSSEGESWVEARSLDVNGNLSASQLVPVRIDRRAPTAEITAPIHGEVITLGAPVVARYGCDDEGSGLVSCEADVPAGVYADASSVGEHSFSLRAVDAAGHVTAVAHAYRVQYAWSGTAGAVGSGVYREVSVGSPLPVHVTLTDARGRLAPDAVVEMALVGPDGIERQPDRWRSALRIDWSAWVSARGAHFELLDTRGLVAGVWTVVVRPDDGTERRMYVLVSD